MTETHLVLPLLADSPKSVMFRICFFGHWILPFDIAQGGEPVEPFGICDLLFVISRLIQIEYFLLQKRLPVTNG